MAQNVNISDVVKDRGKFVARAHRGTRYVILRYRLPLAALISRTDLKRLNGMRSPKVAPKEFTLSAFRAQLPDLAVAAAGGYQYTVTNGVTGERAALVGVEDLKRLESVDREEKSEQDAAERDDTFRRALDEAGLIVSWPSGEPMSMQERLDNLIEVSGQPPSEQAIADRR